MLTPQWPEYLCRWLCLLALVLAQTTSSASNDYRTRRIGITETGGARAAEGGTLAEPKHTGVVFAGGLSLAEYEGASPQTAISNPQSTTVHYTRGPDMGGGVGGLLYANRGGATKFSLSNGRGDIVAQSDAAGALTWTASYEAYGKRTKETGANADKQRANTKDEDPTGLLNEGFRYRDLETGAFISRDPAGFVDGPNLYAYVKQNPWTGWDPHGLSAASKATKLIEGAKQVTEAVIQKVNARNPINAKYAKPGLKPLSEFRDQELADIRKVDPNFRGQKWKKKRTPRFHGSCI